MQRRLTAAGAEAERTASKAFPRTEKTSAESVEKRRKSRRNPAVNAAWKKRETMKGKSGIFDFSVTEATWSITEIPEKEQRAPAAIIPTKPGIFPAERTPEVTSKKPKKRDLRIGFSERRENRFPL